MHDAATSLRDATGDDAAAIAALHADSWRRNYRGAYDDDFLDHHVDADRLAVWTERLGSSDRARRACTVVADRHGAVVGFAHTIFDEDAVWGSLLDNLHVSHDAQRQGLASRLMACTAERLLAAGAGRALYLWVLEQNRGAQAFYLAVGGEVVERAVRALAGGGDGPVLRVAWPDAGTLVSAR